MIKNTLNGSSIKVYFLRSCYFHIAIDDFNIKLDKNQDIKTFFEAFRQMEINTQKVYFFIILQKMSTKSVMDPAETAVHFEKKE